MAAVAEDLALQAGHRFDPPPKVNRSVRRAVRRNGNRALTAAGRRLELKVRNGTKVLRDPERWQEDIWTYYDTVPEVKYIGRFYGNALSRIRLVPGWVVDADESPVPFDQLTDEVLANMDEGDRPPPELAAAAARHTERLSSSSDGQAGIMRAFGENLALVGDCYLLGRQAQDDDDVVGDEVWQVYSTSALSEDPLTSSAGDTITVTVQETPGGKGTPLPEGTDPIVYRVWRRHARWPGLADSNLHACLDEIEELMKWSRMLRAVADSGTNAGLLLIPDELELVDDSEAALPPAAVDDPDDPDDDVPPELDPADDQPADGLTPLERVIMDQFLVPAQSDGTGAAVAPGFVRGKAEYLKELRHLLVERGIDDKIIDRIEFLIRRLAHGADLPVEVLTGVADANHWTGWQIEDSTYKAHVEPTAQIPAAALQACHLRPNLAAEGFASDVLRRTVYLLDASALVVRPNRADDARQLWDRFALSDAALLDAHSFPEGAAPSTEELVRRYLLVRGVGGQELTTALMNQTLLEDDEPIELPERTPSGGPGAPAPPADDETPPEDGGEPTPDTGPDGARTGLVAAGVIPDLGGQLAALERRLRERLQGAASRELENALRRAGSRLRAAVVNGPLRDEVRGQPSEVIGVIVGEQRASEHVDIDTLLAGAFDGLRDQWDAWISQAEAEAASAVNRATPDDATTAEVTDPNDSDRGWAALLAGLMTLARARLFSAVDAGEPGELDEHAPVPAGIVRDALAVAGGGSPGVAPYGTASQSGPGGLLTGPRWTRTLATVGIVRDAWTWQAGFPTSPFEPHQALSGTIFDTWDDPVLSNGTAWPRTSHYYPGDHRGCQCDAIPTLVATSTRTTAGAL